MIIKNAQILTEDFVYTNSDIEFDTQIKTISNNITADDFIDATGLKLIPGFVDIHSHGCVGYDTCDGNLKGYEKMAEFYSNHGVTSYLFTLMTLPEDRLIELFDKANEYISSKNNSFAYPLGFHIEGVFINPEKKGAQALEYIHTPDVEMFKRLYDASNGKLKLVIVAPEKENGLDFINYAKDFVSVSLGHTSANYDMAVKAFDCGAKSITHTFNAMPPIHHRETGVIGAAFDKGSYMELICDGVHVHPSALRIIFNACDNDKLILITDSMAAAGMSDGEFDLGGQAVYVKDKKATLSDGTIAGSTTNLMDCVKNAIKFGLKEEYAIKAASINPATMIGEQQKIGSIALGKNADFNLVDENFNIVHTFIKGIKIK